MVSRSKTGFLKRALEKIFLSHKNKDIGNSINLGLLTVLGFRGRINRPMDSEILDTLLNIWC